MTTDQAVSIAALAAVASLIVTIVGWLLTARAQRQLLARQIEAERERERQRLFLPQRVQQLRDLKSWFEEGLRLLRLIEVKDKDAVQRRSKWVAQYSTFYRFAMRLDSALAANSHAGQQASLAGMVYAYYVIVSDILAKLESMSEPLLEKLEEGGGLLDIFNRDRLFHATDTIYQDAVKRIDELIEQTATPQD
jgi:hypothetical protein